MKKTLLALGMLSTAVAYAQVGRVGINTEKPEATLQIVESNLAPETSPQGVIFPRISSEERLKFQDVTEGTMIYNTTRRCLELFKGLDSGGEFGWHCNVANDAPCGDGGNTTILSGPLYVRFDSFTNTIPTYFAKHQESTLLVMSDTTKSSMSAAQRYSYSRNAEYDYDQANGVIKFAITNNTDKDIVDYDFTNAVKVGSYRESLGLADGYADDTRNKLSVKGFGTEKVTIRQGETVVLEYRLIGTIDSSPYNMMPKEIGAMDLNNGDEEYKLYSVSGYNSLNDVDAVLSEYTVNNTLGRPNRKNPKESAFHNPGEYSDAAYRMLPRYPINFIFEDNNLNLYFEKTLLVEPFIETPTT